jgi:hypothetical protein
MNSLLNVEMSMNVMATLMAAPDKLSRPHLDSAGAVGHSATFDQIARSWRSRGVGWGATFTARK